MAEHDTDSHGDVIRQLHRERGGLIDRLSRSRAILANVKGGLEAEKLVAAQTLGASFPESKESLLGRINELLAEGLFGDGR